MYLLDQTTWIKFHVRELKKPFHKGVAIKRQTWCTWYTLVMICWSRLQDINACSSEIFYSLRTHMTSSNDMWNFQLWDETEIQAYIALHSVHITVMCLGMNMEMQTQSAAAGPADLYRVVLLIVLIVNILGCESNSWSPSLTDLPFPRHHWYAHVLVCAFLNTLRWL